jgi:PAS domain-containing protein
MGDPEQRPVEMILARRLMSNLATPACLVDVGGTLVFFNDAAGRVLGVRYEEAGPMTAQEWGTCFTPTAADGEPVALDELPLAVALNEERPTYRRLHLRAANGRKHALEVSAFPIVGSGGGVRGAMAIFWESTGSG